MNEIKEAALEERQVEEAREWMRNMIENNILPMMTISRFAGFQGAALISKFYHDGLLPLSPKLNLRTARQILLVKEMYEKIYGSIANRPTRSENTI